MNTRKIGWKVEEFVSSFLHKNGYEIIDRNYRTSFGEIDIIALNDGTLVFIEVKYRKNYKFGYPEDAVGYRKLKTIQKVAEHYILNHKNKKEKLPLRYRLEVASVTLVNRSFQVKIIQLV